MGNTYFRFKQFTIHHDQCAMKVGTDGVLLGAWANVSDQDHVLDIGTGTGIIAIMLAQRTKAIVDAIEIDKNAFEQAKKNIFATPWTQQINVQHISLQDYTSNTSIKYTHIISNPPFFDCSLHPDDNTRSMARHTNSLPHEELLQCSKQLLTENGKISLILPYTEACILIAQAIIYGLFCTRKTMVRTSPENPIKRILFELSPQYISCQNDELSIRKTPNQFSEKYKELTKDYYLKF